MAVEIGTATDSLDLYNKLYNFLTADPALVGSSQQWARVSTVGPTPPFTSPGVAGDEAAADVMLKGPGLAGQDEVYVSMRLLSDTSINRQRVQLRGHFGVTDDQTTYFNHINTSDYKGFCVWDAPMAYWFVANGRRFMGVVKLGTVYEVFYAGLYLPFAYPTANPYPLMVGGTLYSGTEYVGPETTGYQHCAFADPQSGGTFNASSLTAVGPAGTWTNFSNGSESLTRWNEPRTATFPYSAPAYPRSLDGDTVVSWTPPNRSNMWELLLNSGIASHKPLLGGGYLLTPVTLAVSNYHSSTSTQDAGVWGEMHGVFHVSGYNNIPENIIQEGGVDHLVVQNVYRTGATDYFAIRLE